LVRLALRILCGEGDCGGESTAAGGERGIIVVVVAWQILKVSRRDSTGSGFKMLKKTPAKFTY